jgi:nucleotide-binding universal stress UspA family protein
MRMFKEIMIPLDGSELAEQALPQAEYLASVGDGTLHLVRVVELPAAVRIQGVGAPVNVYQEVIAEQRRDAMAYLERMRSRLAADGRQVHTRQLDGDEAGALLDYAREAGIDLIVMTTHGRTGLLRWALGTVADRVAHSGSVPVLLVPVHAEA